MSTCVAVKVLSATRAASYTLPRMPERGSGMPNPQTPCYHIIVVNAHNLVVLSDALISTRASTFQLPSAQASSRIRDKVVRHLPVILLGDADRGINKLLRTREE